MRPCPLCGEHREAYPNNRICKVCHRERVRANRRRNKNYGTYKNDSRAKLRRKVDKIKETTPCKDCGLFFPAPVMEFDHLPGTEKIDTISRMVQRQRKWSVIETEMAKCELVCANDHRIRTHITRKQ